LRQVIVEVYVVCCIDPSGLTVSGEVSFFSAFETRSLASRGVISLGNIPICSLVSSPSLTVPSLVIPPVRWGPSACRSIHWNRSVVQPGWHVCGIVLPLGILPLAPWAILPLQEGPVRGPKGVELSWCISLDGVDKLLRFGDTDCPFFYGIVGDWY
jgi:hypothetical protein